MKNFLALAVVFLSLVGVSAAQRGQHGNGGQHNQRQNQPRIQQQPRIQHEQRNEPRHNDNRGWQRNDRSFHQERDRRDERAFHEQHEYRGYHWGRGDARRHWDGRRFDHEYFESRWGYGHRFYWSHCEWYGPRYYPGSYFWYGGAYFVIVDAVPAYWDEEEVVVIYDDGYWLVNPVYPGIRFHVGIRF